jgi:hypothetical protein
VPLSEAAGADEVPDRLAQPVLVGDRKREVVVRFAGIRLQPERLAKRAFGFGVPALLAAGAAILQKLVEIYAA